MKYISKTIIHFSKWSRKGYAVFAALGKEVYIAGLALHICSSALLKSALKGTITTTAKENDSYFDSLEETSLLKSVGYVFIKGDVCPDSFNNKRYRKGYTM